MRPFYTLYNKILEWSSSRFAVIWLATISFLESSILPYPIQDILLALCHSRVEIGLTTLQLLAH